ncbi:Nuclear transport factor 2 [Morella rubra]|uniref:Nuclear transport factor 2 n=1 Tax=Morella rubra TaxID=262757 RepID=A0A6A1VNS1_9ROSI|nr:Nuclear transport factor 2 [Morella rubra]
MATVRMVVEERVMQVSQDSLRGLQEQRIYHSSWSQTFYQGPVESATTDQESAAKEFVRIYYEVFDLNPPELLGVYQEGSMLTFNGDRIQGSQNIVTKLNERPPQLQACHFQRGMPAIRPRRGVFAMAKGELKHSDGLHAFKFSEVFLQTPS